MLETILLPVSLLFFGSIVSLLVWGRFFTYSFFKTFSGLYIKFKPPVLFLTAFSVVFLMPFVIVITLVKDNFGDEPRETGIPALTDALSANYLLITSVFIITSLVFYLLKFGQRASDEQRKLKDEFNKQIESYENYKK